MIPYLGCHTARAMLEAFLDAELTVDEQVALDAHLRWCDTCRARVDDLRVIGKALLARSARPFATAADEAALVGVQERVLARVRADRGESLPGRWRALPWDSRFLWPALAATALAVLIAGRSPAPALPAPRPLAPPPVPALAPEGEAVFLLSGAVVNGGGRVATYELLRSSDEPAAEVSALADALRDTRFAPKTTRGDVVVWLVARTTVRGSMDPAAERPLTDEARPAPRPARS